MSKLLDRLSDPLKSGVYRVPEERVVREALQGGTHDLGFVALGSDKDAMLKAIAQSLRFPEWFGANWDALEDCLTDLSWRDGTGHVILFSGAHPGDDLGILIDVLSSAAEFWREQRSVFFAVFVDPENKLALPRLYRTRPP
jgi:hypothetical protein